jgi:hypothetical protein
VGWWLLSDPIGQARFVGFGLVPVLRLIQKQSASFTPEDVVAIDAAFEHCLRELGLKRRSDPVVNSLARKLIELAKAGERDPTRLRDATLNWVRDKLPPCA